MAKRPVVGAIERDVAKGAVVGTVFGGGHVLNTFLGSVAYGVIGLLEPAFHKLRKDQQKKSVERYRTNAGRRRQPIATAMKPMWSSP
jgi:hypothetical protein